MFRKSKKNNLQKENTAPQQFSLTDSDFEEMFEKDLSGYIRGRIKEYYFAYEKPSESERDEYLLKIIKTLLADFIVYAGEHRREQWEKGWGENLENLDKEELTNAIKPRYFGKYNILRIKQNFIKPISDNFEQNSLAIILDWLADKYMREADAVYEFGCGTGHHLKNIRKINQRAKIYGLDWVESSQKIIEKMAKELSDENLFSHKFDFFNPDYGFSLEKNSVIYTVAALEQTGDSYVNFIDYLMENKPKLCVHIEPIGELLDENNLLDYLSIEYFKKRKYLSGFLDYLRGIEKEGKIEIIKAQRSYIGSLFIDGYSIIVWKLKNVER